MRTKLTVGCAGLSLALATQAAAQTPDEMGTTPPRPIPYPMEEVPGFANAVEAGTRTRTGEPGPDYWQQYARYQIEVSLDPDTDRLAGSASAWYINNSPDSLPVVLLHNRHNLFAPGAQRNQAVPVVDSVEISHLSVEGATYERAPQGQQPPQGSYVLQGTIMGVILQTPLAPGDSAKVSIDWSFTVPREAPRGGKTGNSTYFISYWYPQFAVYDDVDGWHADQYLGTAEFYMGYADYDVAVTVPDGWLVSGTGSFQNADEVLAESALRRLQRAQRSRDVVNVVTEDNRGVGLATQRGADGTLTWRFRASNVRDFAWATSPDYLWDATIALVGDADGDSRPDTSQINALYRPFRRNHYFDAAARFGQHSIETLSDSLWSYPYPQMSVIDGPASCGGMEFPMLTCIGGSSWDSTNMYGVIVHELAHMWFPMMVGSDEKRHPWMDEGLTQFNQARGSNAYFPGSNDEANTRGFYQFGASQNEEPLMRHGDKYASGLGYGVAAYAKPAVILMTLRGLLGEELFWRAFREYGRRWNGKHPKPSDLFNTFEDVSGRDLDWFWRTWFYETWTLDQGVESVATSGDETTITVRDYGFAPMPVLLSITRENESSELITIPVDVWLSGAVSHSVTVVTNPAVTRVEIDPEGLFPDVDRSNQTWTSQSKGDNQ